MLKQYQHEFSDYLKGINAGIAEQFINPQHMGRLSIYKNNFIQVSVGALQKIYEKTALLVGKECFEHYAAKFVCQQPAMASNLLYYDYGFIQYLCALEAMQNLRYLNDFMNLEYALHVVYHASGEGAPLTAQEMAGVGLTDILQLRGLYKTFKSRYNVYGIYRYCENMEEEPFITEQKTEYLLLSRRGFKLEIEPISEEYYALLHGFENNELTLEQVFGNMDLEADQISRAFARAIEAGLLIYKRG